MFKRRLITIATCWLMGFILLMFGMVYCNTIGEIAVVGFLMIIFLSKSIAEILILYFD